MTEHPALPSTATTRADVGRLAGVLRSVHDDWIHHDDGTEDSPWPDVARMALRSTTVRRVVAARTALQEAPGVAAGVRDAIAGSVHVASEAAEATDRVLAALAAAPGSWDVLERLAARWEGEAAEYDPDDVLGSELRHRARELQSAVAASALAAQWSAATGGQAAEKAPACICMEAHKDHFIIDPECRAGSWAHWWVGTSRAALPAAPAPGQVPPASDAEVSAVVRVLDQWGVRHPAGIGALARALAAARPAAHPVDDAIREAVRALLDEVDGGTVPPVAHPSWKRLAAAADRTEVVLAAAPAPLDDEPAHRPLDAPAVAAEAISMYVEGREVHGRDHAQALAEAVQTVRDAQPARLDDDRAAVTG